MASPNFIRSQSGQGIRLSKTPKMGSPFSLVAGYHGPEGTSSFWHPAAEKTRKRIRANREKREVWMYGFIFNFFNQKDFLCRFVGNERNGFILPNRLAFSLFKYKKWVRGGQTLFWEEAGHYRRTVPTTKGAERTKIMTVHTGLPPKRAGILRFGIVRISFWYRRKKSTIYGTRS